MGAAIQDHVGKEFFLVNLTSIGAGSSDANGHLVFDQVGQVVIGAITGGCVRR
jgi:xanthine/CO dehydrogenase XdhC/CoxF family maturation factor